MGWVAAVLFNLGKLEAKLRKSILRLFRRMITYTAAYTPVITLTVCVYG